MCVPVSGKLIGSGAISQFQTGEGTVNLLEATPVEVSKKLNHTMGSIKSTRMMIQRIVCEKQFHYLYHPTSTHRLQI